MGTELAQTSTAYASEDRRWLASDHGQDTNRPVTLNGDLFAAGPFPDGRVPSGQVIGIVTATGLAGPYDNAAADGREVAAGHLLNTEIVGAAAGAGRRVSTAVVTHGVVNRNLLPAGAGLDAGAEADLKHIRYQTR